MRPVWKDTTLVEEQEIMRVARADIRNNDHGGAVIEIDLRSQSTGQSVMYAIDPAKAYQLLCLFNVEFLSDAAGKPCRVIRKERGGVIHALGNLECDPWIEVER